jgi:O-antigen ligase
MPEALPAGPCTPSTESRRRSTRTAFWALTAFTFCIPWENIVVIPGVGTIAKVAGLLAFVVALVALADSRTLRPLSAPHLPMVLFVLWACLSYLWTSSSARSPASIATWPQLLGLVWLIWQFAPDAADVIFLLKAYVLGSYVSSLDTIAVYVTGQKMEHYHRYVASGFNPDDLGLILVLSLPMTLYICASAPQGKRLWIYWLQPAAAVTAILLTASRGAALAGVCSLIIIPLVWKQLAGRTTSLLLAGALTASVAALVVPDTSWQRIAGTFEELRTGTLNKRITFWKAGIDVLEEHPIVGVGSGAYAPSVEKTLGSVKGDVAVAHNTFISVLVEVGAIGLSLWLTILLTLALSLRRMPQLELRFWAVLLLAWGIGVMAATWETRKPTWLLFGMLAAHAAACDRARGYLPPATRHE